MTFPLITHHVPRRETASWLPEHEHIPSGGLATKARHPSLVSHFLKKLNLQFINQEHSTETFARSNMTHPPHRPANSYPVPRAGPHEIQDVVSPKKREYDRHDGTGRW